MALVITTYTVTQVVFSLLQHYQECVLQEEQETTSGRDFIQMEIYFSGQKKVNEWHCVVSNKCTKSDTTVIKLTLKNIYLVWESHFQFMAYSTAGMGVQ